MTQERLIEAWELLPPHEKIAVAYMLLPVYKDILCLAQKQSPDVGCLDADGNMTDCPNISIIEEFIPLAENYIAAYETGGGPTDVDLREIKQNPFKTIVDETIKKNLTKQ